MPLLGIGPCVLSVIQLLLVASTASIEPIVPSSDATTFLAVDYSPVSSPGSNNVTGTAVTPLTNSVVNVYNEAGWNGNATIYPTTDTNPSYLPTLESAATTNTTYVTQTLRNALSINTNGLTAQKSFFQYVTGAKWVQIDIWVGTTGVSPTVVIGGAWPFATVTYQNLSEELSGAVTGTHTDVQTAWDTGANVTTGNDGSNSNGVVTSLADAALQIGEQLITNLGWIATGWNVALDLVQASGAVMETYITDAIGASNVGIQNVNQWSQVSGGNISSTRDNVFNQDTLIETTMSYPNATVPGDLQLQATNEISLCSENSAGSSVPCGLTPPADPQPGGSTGAEYAVDPAAGVGGFVTLWSGGPAVPLANVVIQQQYTSTTFQSNYENPNSSTGYYHVFLEPLSGGANTYTQLNAYLSDPMGDTDTNLGELPLTDWTHDGTDVETVSTSLDGGQLNGTISGLPTHGSLENLAGASVELCNSQGCISTITNSAGQYALQFPVAGTGSDKDSITVSKVGWTTSEVTGLEFPVGQYSQESVTLRPAAGCVAQGTPVLTPDGYVPVQDLRSGQTVLEYDFASQSLVPVEVVSANHTTVGKVVSIDNGLLYLTPTDQPIYIQNSTYIGWLSDPQNLSIGDSLFNPVTQSWMQVKSIATLLDETTVYDVVTAGFGNFVANSVLVGEAT